jgi:hypothetical protein
MGGAAMVVVERTLGLCSTCVSNSVCSRRKGAGSSVLFCEEFDDSVALKPGNKPIPVRLEQKIPLDTRMGLCCNCGNHDSCTLQRSPGGVWHCEQYW